MYQEGLGRVFNVAPIAASQGISIKDASAISFVLTGADTFTLTGAATFAGSYTTPGAIITRRHNNTATNGTGTWTRVTQAAANTVVVASGATVVTIGQNQLPDNVNYLKVTPSGSGLVQAYVHDLKVKREPGNLPALGA